MFQTHCSHCHGARGEGGRGADLTEGVYRYGGTDAELFKTVRSGVPGSEMPAVRATDDDIWKIVAFVRRVGSQGLLEKAPGDSAAGRAVYAKNGCASCHRIGPDGTDLGPDLTDVGRMKRATELERALVDPPKEVLPQNRMARVVTRDGTTVTGRLMHHDTFTVLLMDAGEHLRAFSKSDLRDVTIIKTSTKASYRGMLTPQEIADVVGYLVSLNGGKGTP